MNYTLAQRMSRLGTETAFEVMARAKKLEAQGREIIHLEIGEPDFTTPEHIKEAAIRALRAGKTGYCPAPGIPELREAIAEDAGKRRSVAFKPEQVVVTPGAKPIIFYTVLAVVETDDEVLVPDPSYPIYDSIVQFVGGKPVYYSLREDLQFRLDLDEFESLITPRTKLAILGYPENPTGAHLGKEILSRIADLAMKHNFFILADEVYLNMLYDDIFTSIASFPGMLDQTIVLDSFSKTYAMTGWRIGYGILPEAWVEPVTKLTINSVSCTSHFSQYGAIEALRGPQDAVTKMAAEFKRRRDFIVRRLNEMQGISCVMPHGAFYVFPNIKKLGIGSRDMETRLLQEAGVAVLTGTAFGARGEGYIRLSYANSMENIEKALNRIEEFIAKIS